MELIITISISDLTPREFKILESGIGDNIQEFTDIKNKVKLLVSDILINELDNERIQLDIDLG
jgi:hypothetical protein